MTVPFAPHYVQPLPTEEQRESALASYLKDLPLNRHLWLPLRVLSRMG